MPFWIPGRFDPARRRAFLEKKRPEPLHLSDLHYISDEALKKGIGF
jgi:hypothetical protein